MASMKLLLFFLLCVVAHFSMFGGILDDPHLAQLEAALADAETQVDLNRKSAAIMNYIDEKLLEIEASVTVKVREDRRVAFQESSELWRRYRKQFVTVCSDEYEGGSIQPLIYALAWSRTTKARIVELEEFYGDLIQGED